LSGIGNEIAPDDMKSRFGQIVELQSRLVEAGIIDKPETSDLNPDLLNNDMLKSPNTSLFLNDTLNKLMIYKPLLERIELLKKLVNKRYLFKKLNINKYLGFEFIAKSGRSISPPQLSSGEQHLLVMFFDLIFKTQPGTLVLIDEPELSLHLIWQNDFLKALSQIIEINEIDIIIATHAPDLIQDRWDLTVELKGIEDDNEK
jgi:predicted ATP-binding protein involved in virulence